MEVKLDLHIHSAHSPDGRIGVFLRSIADLFTAKEALRCRGDNRVFWVYLKNSLFARG